MTAAGDTVPVEGLETAAYEIPTDAPESDGTLAWDSTTQRAVRNLGKPGVAAEAISAVDIALWDLHCRLLDLPLAIALGAVHPTVPIYGSDGFTSYSDHALAEQLSGWVQAGIPRLRAVAGDPADLQIMYGIGGERHPVEWELDWLPGHHGARPVRVGNAAHRQIQLDVYGEIMDALHLARERGLEPDEHAWALQRELLAHLATVWQQPGNGLWEVRGPKRHFTHSRVMVWVAFDRGVRAVRDYGLDGPAEQWAKLRGAVHEEVLAHGFNERLGAFTQYYGGTELDAATLLIPSVGFLPGDDPRVVATLDAVGRTLKRGDLVDRYSTGEQTSAVDGLAGREGAFVVCSFWYVDALALAGRRDEAEAMFARLVALGNDVGLFAEEYDDASGRFLGNFPQAFSHLGPVSSAALLWGEIGRHRRERARR